MRPILLKDISDQVVPILSEAPFSSHITKIWQYEGLCFVVDFSYKGLKLAFNFLPQSAETVSLEVIKRRCDTPFHITSNYSESEFILQGVSVENACAALCDKVMQILVEYDAYIIKERKNAAFLKSQSMENG